MFSASISGMSVARTGLDVTADNIANVNTAGHRPARTELAALTGQAGAEVTAVSRPGELPAGGLSGTELGAEMSALIVAGAVYGANAAVLRTQLETTGTLLDVRA